MVFDSKNKFLSRGYHKIVEPSTSEYTFAIEGIKALFSTTGSPALQPFVGERKTTLTLKIMSTIYTRDLFSTTPSSVLSASESFFNRKNEQFKFKVKITAKTITGTGINPYPANVVIPCGLTEGAFSSEIVFNTEIRSDGFTGIDDIDIYFDLPDYENFRDPAMAGSINPIVNTAAENAKPRSLKFQMKIELLDANGNRIKRAYNDGYLSYDSLISSDDPNFASYEESHWLVDHVEFTLQPTTYTYYIGVVKSLVTCNTGGSTTVGELSGPPTFSGVHESGRCDLYTVDAGPIFPGLQLYFGGPWYDFIEWRGNRTCEHAGDYPLNYNVVGDLVNFASDLAFLDLVPTGETVPTSITTIHKNPTDGYLTTLFGFTMHWNRLSTVQKVFRSRPTFLTTKDTYRDRPISAWDGRKWLGEGIIEPHTSTYLQINDAGPRSGYSISLGVFGNNTDFNTNRTPPESAIDLFAIFNDELDLEISHRQVVLETINADLYSGETPLASGFEGYDDSEFET